MNFKLLLDKSPICFAQVDFDKRILYANPALCAFTGYSCEELKSKHISEITNPDDIENDILEFNQLVKGEITEYRLQKRYIQKSGKMVWGDLFVTIIPDDLRDSYFSILASVVDITELKEKEAGIKEERSNFKAMFMNNPQAMGIYSIETYEILEINEAACCLYGYTRAELLKMKVTDLISTRDEAKFRDFMSQNPSRLNEGQFWEMITKSEDIRIVETTSHLINYKSIPAFHVMVIDITERKKAEIALKEEESFISYSEVIAKMGSWEWDVVKNVTKWSANLFRLFKVNPEEVALSYEYFMSKVHPNDHLIISNAYECILKEKKQIEIEFRILLPGDEILWMQNNILPFFENDQLIRLKGVNIDITERKTNEIALLKNRDSIRQAQVIAKMGSWEYDPIHDIGTWSENLFQVLKVDPSHTDLSFDFFKSLIHPDDLHHFENCNEKFINREKIIMEVRIQLPNNNFIWVENHIESVYEDDLLINIRGVIIDITERKKGETELLKLSKAVDQSPVSIFLTDTKGNIEYINPKFTEITGYKRHEVLGKNPRILKSNRMDEQVYSDLWMTISSGKNWKGELINKHKSGEFYWENKFISPIIDELGDIINYISIGENITIKKRTEIALLEAKEKAEESSRLKSTFLAIISHELRTPLNPIIGLSSILKEGSNDKMVIEFASLIHNSGNEMLKLIEDLFDLSFFQGQNIKCNSKPILYIDLYSIALAYLEEIIINSGKSDRIEIISIDHTKSVNYEIEVDQAKVLQVLSILFKNAVKFIHHGEVEFGTEIDKDVNTLSLFVRDTGIGIEEEKIRIIFNRFRQADDSNTRPFGGLGIGLTIAKQLVNIMGGTIDVESQVGIGSKFSFTIPVNINLQERSDHNPNILIHGDEISVLNGKTILIVDDNLFVHEIIKLQLRKFDIKILSASNGLEAIRIVKNQIPDFILMDLVMPVMDGFEAVTYIRALHPKIPITALTAHSLPKDRRRALEVGCDEIITKPVHRDILLHILKKHLGKRISANVQKN